MRRIIIDDDEPTKSYGEGFVADTGFQELLDGVDYGETEPAPFDFGEPGEDYGDLVQTPDGYTVAPRTTELASVASDPFKTKGNLGKLTPDQRRLRDTFRERSNDAANDTFTYDHKDGEKGEGRNFSVKDGWATGAPVGRPQVGTKDPNAAAKLLEEQDGRSIEELRGLIGRGKRADPGLKKAVSALKAANRATDQALAKALECSRSTVHKLAE